MHNVEGFESLRAIVYKQMYAIQKLLYIDLYDERIHSIMMA